MPRRSDEELEQELCRMRVARKGMCMEDSIRLNKMCCVALRFALGELDRMSSPDQEKDLP